MSIFECPRKGVAGAGWRVGKAHADLAIGVVDFLRIIRILWDFTHEGRILNGPIDAASGNPAVVGPKKSAR
jgi:hypothetical protein